MYHNLCTISTIHKIIHEDTIKKLVLKNKAPLHCLQKPDEDFINKVLKKFPTEIINIQNHNNINTTYDQIIKSIDVNPNTYWILYLYIATNMKDNFELITKYALGKNGFKIANGNMVNGNIVMDLILSKDELIKLALVHNGSIIEKINNTNPNKQQYALIALDSYPSAIKYIEKTKQTNEQCINVLSKDLTLYTFCNFIPDNFHNKILARITIVKYNNKCPNTGFNLNNEILLYNVLYRRMISSFEVNIEFAKQGSPHFISRENYKNPVFIKEVQKYDSTVIFNIDKPTNQDYIKALRLDGMVLWAVQIQTDEMCMIAVKQNPEAIVYVHTQTEEICKYVYEANPKLLIFFEDKFDYLTDLPKSNIN
jgi:hypothetical protein